MPEQISPDPEGVDEDTDTPARAWAALSESRARSEQADTLIAESQRITARLRESRRRPDYIVDKLRIIIQGGHAA